MIFDVNAWCYAYVCKICPLGNYSAKSNECVEDELIESNQRSFKIQTSIWWTGSWSPFHIYITFAHCLSKARSSLNPFWYYEWALQQIISDHKAIKTLVKPLKQLSTASRLSTLPTQWKTHTLQLSPIPKKHPHLGPIILGPVHLWTRFQLHISGRWSSGNNLGVYFTHFAGLEGHYIGFRSMSLL